MLKYIKLLFKSKKMKTLQEIKDELTAVQTTLTSVQEALATAQTDIQVLEDSVTPTPTPEIPKITVPLNTPIELVG